MNIHRRVMADHQDDTLTDKERSKKVMTCITTYFATMKRKHHRIQNNEMEKFNGQARLRVRKSRVS